MAGRPARRRPRPRRAHGPVPQGGRGRGIGRPRRSPPCSPSSRPGTPAPRASCATPCRAIGIATCSPRSSDAIDHPSLDGEACDALPDGVAAAGRRRLATAQEVRPRAADRATPTRRSTRSASAPSGPDTRPRWSRPSCPGPTPRGARRFIRGATRVQDVLGEHQDAVVAGQCSPSSSPGAPTAPAFDARPPPPARWPGRSGPCRPRGVLRRLGPARPQEGAAMARSAKAVQGPTSVQPIATPRDMSHDEHRPRSPRHHPIRRATAVTGHADRCGPRQGPGLRDGRRSPRRPRARSSTTAGPSISAAGIAWSNSRPIRRGMRVPTPPRATTTSSS